MGLGAGRAHRMCSLTPVVSAGEALVRENLEHPLRGDVGIAREQLFDASAIGVDLGGARRTHRPRWQRRVSGIARLGVCAEDLANGVSTDSKSARDGAATHSLRREQHDLKGQLLASPPARRHGTCAAALLAIAPAMARARGQEHACELAETLPNEIRRARRECGQGRGGQAGLEPSGGPLDRRDVEGDRLDDAAGRAHAGPGEPRIAPRPAREHRSENIWLRGVQQLAHQESRLPHGRARAESTTPAARVWLPRGNAATEHRLPLAVRRASPNARRPARSCRGASTRHVQAPANPALVTTKARRDRALAQRCGRGAARADDPSLLERRQTAAHMPLAHVHGRLDDVHRDDDGA